MVKRWGNEALPIVVQGICPLPSLNSTSNASPSERISITVPTPSSANITLPQKALRFKQKICIICIGKIKTMKLQILETHCIGDSHGKYKNP